MYAKRVKSVADLDFTIIRAQFRGQTKRGSPNERDGKTESVAIKNRQMQ